MSASRDGDFEKLHKLRSNVSSRIFRATWFRSNTQGMHSPDGAHAKGRELDKRDLKKWFEDLAGPKHIRQFRDFMTIANGNWIEPMVDKPRDGATGTGSGAFMIRHLHTCRTMIRKAEQERGARYAWVRFLRSDTFWCAVHTLARRYLHGSIPVVLLYEL